MSDRRADEATSAQLNNCLPFSMVDGPGNRFVVFLQGCNFDCIACHNPYTINQCSGCGVCVGDCPTDALTIRAGAAPIVDVDRCNGCESCVDVCVDDSTPLSTVATVGQVIRQIREVSPFISGVTVSGGEATQQADFVHDLFARLKADPALGELTTFVDTNGSAPIAVWDRLAPVLDGAMVDLKAFDPSVHRAITGQPNASVLTSIEHLAWIGLLHEIRMLVLPGLNDDAETLADTGAWIHRVAPGVAVKLIGFRRHGTRPHAARLDEPTADQLDAFATVLRCAGVVDVVVI